MHFSSLSGFKANLSLLLFLCCAYFGVLFISQLYFKFQFGFLENDLAEADCEITPQQKVNRNRAEMLTIGRGLHTKSVI